MKKSLFRPLALLLMLVLIVGVYGSVIPASAQAATPEVTGTLSFLSWYTQDQMQPLLDAFTAKYPNVTFDFQNVPPANNQYTQRLQLLASSGELPDLFYVQPPITLFAKN